MRFVIIVHGEPFTSEASITSLRLARVAVAAGHEITRVFFFHEGVLNANALSVEAPDALSMRAAWVELARRIGVELAVCITAGLKRGVVDDAERNRHHLGGVSLHPAFTLVGLGQLIDAARQCDRLITFAA